MKKEKKKKKKKTKQQQQHKVGVATRVLFYIIIVNWPLSTIGV